MVPTVGSGKKSRSRLTVSLRGRSPQWNAITPARYIAENIKETNIILTKAPAVPTVMEKYGIALMIAAVPTPAPTDAAKNFQTTPNTAPIYSPIGFPAYQNPGNIRRK
jgi:hypothetical protein